MKKILQKLFHQQSLTQEEAKNILGEISEGIYHPYQVSSFLTVFKMRPITVDELLGFRNCLKERAVPLDLSEFNPVDLCGTGGDGKDTFNISTLSSFIVAGAGYKVAKHGNNSVSSICGSSNVMQYLGVRFTNDESTLKKQLDQAGICFLHAPLFHPAMKEVAPIRKNLSIQTFFNILGPMVNPSNPKKQLVGVFSLPLLRYYKYIYEQESVEFRIVHSLDGYDEISLTGNAKVITPKKEYILRPESYFEEKLRENELSGGNDVESSALIFKNIMNGNGTKAQNNVVLANAALAIQCTETEKSYEDCIDIARESLQTGNAKRAFEKLVAL